MRIAEAVAMTNAVFKKRFGRENVIALWTETQLSTFATTELTTLKSLAESERLLDPAMHDVCGRLIKRIDLVWRRRNE